MSCICNEQRSWEGFGSSPGGGNKLRAQSRSSANGVSPVLRGRGPAGLLDPLLGALGALMPSEKSRAGSRGCFQGAGRLQHPC